MKLSLKKTFGTLLSLLMLLPLLSGIANAHTLTTTSGATELRVTVDRLLGEHALLAVIAMQKGIEGKADFGDIAASLATNTDDLSAAIASVYGEAAGEAFKTMWSSHIGFFVDLVKATAANDEAGRKAALDHLDNYRMDFAEFLAGANPNLKAEDLAAGLQVHVNQLVKAFDEYVAKDYEGAYASLREAYSHMFMTGDALAGAIATQFPEKFPAASTSMKAADLRVALDRLLGEHAYLAVLAMQKGIDGAPDFAAVAGALNGNTEDLSAAIASVYGSSAGDAFNDLWSSHIGFFVDLVKATATNDTAGRKAALDKLDNYRVDFSNFLAGANPNLKADSLAAGLQMHVQQLVNAFDMYVAKKYTDVYPYVREAYKHMGMTGDALAGAIVTQFNEKFHDDATGTEPQEENDMTHVMKIWMQIGNTSLTIDSKTTEMSVAPFLWSGWTFVPVRYLSEGIGATVSWDDKTQTAWVKAGDDTLTFWVGKDYMMVNDQKKEIGSKVILKNGRIFLPLRFITELLGWDVQYSNKDWSITLTKTMMMHMH